MRFDDARWLKLVVVGSIGWRSRKSDYGVLVARSIATPISVATPSTPGSARWARSSRC